MIVKISRPFATISNCNETCPEFEADLEDAVDEAGVAGVDEARDAARPLLRPEGGRTHEDVEADGHGAAQREAGEVVRHEPGHGHGAGHVSRARVGHGVD